MNIFDDIIKTINDEMSIEMNEYAGMLDSINSCTNLYELFTKTCKLPINREKKMNFLLEILGDILYHPFFEKANVKVCGCNINYSDNEFLITFNISANNISIKYMDSNGITMPKRKKAFSNDDNVRLELTEQWVNNKSIKALRMLANTYYSRYRKNPIAKTVQYSKAIKKFNKTYIEELYDKKNLDEQYFKEYLDDKYNFELLQIYARANVRTIVESLKELHNCGMDICIYNILDENNDLHMFNPMCYNEFTRLFKKGEKYHVIRQNKEYTM